MARIVKGIILDGCVSVTAVKCTDAVNRAISLHGLSPVAAAALGRTLAATLEIASGLKGATDSVTVNIKGEGPLGRIVTACDSRLNVRGYVENPQADLPLKANGKLDVALAVGWFGDLTVIRDMGLKEPYVGTCPIQSGEIAEDFARYFTVSEQQPSLVYLGVRVDAESGAVRAASGLLAQPLPGCPDEVIDALTEKAKEIETLTSTLERGTSLKDALMQLFGGMGFAITANQHPEFRCDCSRERLERVLISLGEAELSDMIAQEHGAELTCHFCNKKYQFNEDDLRRLLAEAKGNDNA